MVGTGPKNSHWFELMGLVAGTKVWSLPLDFRAKLAGLHVHDRTCPCDLLQGLVTKTSSFMCADLYNFLLSFFSIYNP